MSFFQSLFGAPAAAPQNNSAAPQGQQPQGQSQEQQAVEPASPLDSFKDLWQNANNEQGNDSSSDALFNVDPKALNETVGKMNFLGNIPPKVQEALKAGGEEAVRANLYLMNQVAQQSFAQSAQTTTRIVEAALAKQAEAFESRVSEVVRKQGASEQLKSANPAFSHPAAAPILEGIQVQMQKKFPNASASEIANMAQSYFTTFAQEITGAGKPKAKPGKSDSDFSDFFS